MKPVNFQSVHQSAKCLRRYGSFKGALLMHQVPLQVCKVLPIHFQVLHAIKVSFYAHAEVVVNFFEFVRIRNLYF